MGRARPAEPLSVWCELQIPGVCAGRATERHHKQRRSQGGSDEPENTIDACWACHTHVHANPELAYEHDWMRHGWPGG